MITLDMESYHVVLSHDDETESGCVIERIPQDGRVRFEHNEGCPYIFRYWRKPAEMADILRRLADEIQSMEAMNVHNP